MLAEFLTLNAFQLVLVFARVGTAFMLLPGFSAAYVNPRLRLLLAVMVTLVVAPVLKPLLPLMPETVGALVKLVAFEATYGLFLGLVGRVLLTAIHLAGTSIGHNSGLMNAMVFDPVTEQQGALVIGLLSNIAIVSVFVMDLHHVMIEAVVASYVLFEPGTAPLAADHMAYITNVLAQSFYIGLQLAAPFLVFAVVFQATMGLMARLSPQMNVFFVALPLQVLVGLALLWVSLPAMMLWFLGYFEDTYMAFMPN